MYYFVWYFTKCTILFGILLNVLFRSVFYKMYYFVWYFTKCTISFGILLNVLFRSVFYKMYYFVWYFNKCTISFGILLIIPNFSFMPVDINPINSNYYSLNDFGLLSDEILFWTTKGCIPYVKRH